MSKLQVEMVRAALQGLEHGKYYHQCYSAVQLEVQVVTLTGQRLGLSLSHAGGPGSMALAVTRAAAGYRTGPRRLPLAQWQCSAAPCRCGSRRSSSVPPPRPGPHAGARRRRAARGGGRTGSGGDSGSDSLPVAASGHEIASDRRNMQVPPLPGAAGPADYLIDSVIGRKLQRLNLQSFR